MARPETTIRLAIVRFMKDQGFAVWDMEQNRKTRQTPGFSDLAIFGRGLILFVEVKTEKGTQSDHQKVFEHEVNSNGGTYLVWRSVHDAWDYLVSIGEITPA